eukprot:6963363-Pyramimonas_sp.AAC.1
MRHGGPSEDRRENVRTPLEVKQRGRWSADASMRRYEAAAWLQREEAQLPRAVMTAALAALHSLPSALTASLSRRLVPARGAATASRSSPAAAASRSSWPAGAT